MAKSFYDLNIWKKGHELLMRIYEVTAKYPSGEKFGLTSQTRNSANSVIANIAESHVDIILPIKSVFFIPQEVRLRRFVVI